MSDSFTGLSVGLVDDNERHRATLSPSLNEIVAFISGFVNAKPPIAICRFTAEEENDVILYIPDNGRDKEKGYEGNEGSNGIL